MATVGNTAAPTQTFGAFGLNFCDTLAVQATMPAGGGTITSISCYFAGNGGTTHAQNCVWNASRVLIAHTGTFAVGAGSGGLQGQQLNTANVVTPVFVAGGATIYIGMWRFATEPFEWTENNGGTEQQFTQDSNNNTSPPSGFGGWTPISGSPQMFATYTTGKLAIRRGVAWNGVTGKIRRTGAWTTPSGFIRRAGAWVQLQ